MIWAVRYDNIDIELIGIADMIEHGIEIIIWKMTKMLDNKLDINNIYEDTQLDLYSIVIHRKGYRYCCGWILLSFTYIFCIMDI